MGWKETILRQLKERDEEVIRKSQEYLDKNDGKVFILDEQSDYTILKLHSKEGLDRFVIYNYSSLISKT